MEHMGYISQTWYCTREWRLAEIFRDDGFSEEKNWARAKIHLTVLPHDVQKMTGAKKWCQVQLRIFDLFDPQNLLVISPNKNYWKNMALFIAS